MMQDKFLSELQDRDNRERCLQAIRTRYLIILSVWTFALVAYFSEGMVFYLAPIHIVTGLALIINSVSYYFTRRWQFPLTVVVISTVADMIAITALVYFTGGLKSIFFLLYLVQVLGVSLFLNLTFSAFMIIWAMILIGVMRSLESFGLIAASSMFIPTTYSEFIDAVIWLVFQTMALCLVAFLGGNLSSKLKSQERELKQKVELERLYEALHKANESKTRLLANVSHNLRTPLTSIMGFSELLLGKDEGTSQREEFTRIINSESRHLSRLVNDITYLWQLEDKIEWNIAEINISEVVTEAVAAMQASAFAKSLKLEVDNHAPSLLIYGDFDSLKDITARVIDNAIKFTVEGAVKVGITSKEDYACIYVSDTGIGIATDIGDKIFEPLVEIYKAGYKEVSQRTGLGLAICKAVLQHHGGKIWFESKPNMGSTFYLAVPQARRK